MRSVLLFLLLSITAYSQYLAPISEKLESKIKSTSKNELVKIWIYFKDKGSHNLEKYRTNELISERAAKRRSKVLPINKLVDERDLPVSQDYIGQISSKVTSVRYASKWFNSLSCIANIEEIEEVRKLPFVAKIDIVSSYGKAKEEEIIEVTEDQIEQNKADSLNYGTGRKQVDQINVISLHNRGIRGEGVIVGVFDNGFSLMSHESFAQMNILAKYDFVDNDPFPDIVPSGAGAHGVNTLSTIGGYKSGQLIGPAYKASFILARTENDFSETPVEEDNWVRAIEWAESLGVDVTSTSLGYLTYDSPYPSWTWQNMDGNTTIITKAANRADTLGVVVVNSAGNEASVGTPNTLVAPADGFGVLAVGAVDSFGVRSYFSSYGPSYDGRIKPDVMAMGTAVKVASASITTGYSRANGTSFSCPLAAGVAALILDAHPSLTPTQVRTAMRMTASKWKTPDNLYGYGILNATAAVDYFKPLVLHTPLSGIKLATPQNIIVTINSVINLKLDSCRVFYGINGNFGNFVTLTPTGNLNEYSATIPAYPLYSIVNYYIHVENVDGDVVKLPSNAPISYYNYTIGGTNTNLQLSIGWNLISIPLHLEDYAVNNILPNAASNVYSYDNSKFVITNSLQNGKGYWVKYNSDTTLSISGYITNVDTINVTQGWNLIGISLLTPVSITSIQQEPANNIISNFFYYHNNQYDAAETLIPNFGYWVKVRQAGKLIINSTN